MAWIGQLQKSLSAADLTNGSCRQGTASRLHSSDLPRSSQRSIKSFLKCGVSPTRHSAFATDSQVTFALHMMAVRQVHQVKLLHDMDESRSDPAMFKELRNAAHLALGTLLKPLPKPSAMLWPA